MVWIISVCISVLIVLNMGIAYKKKGQPRAALKTKL